MPSTHPENGKPIDQLIEAKRGRGRPQELADPVTTTIRIEREDLEQLDRWAATRSLSRSQAVAAAIRAIC